MLENNIKQKIKLLVSSFSITALTLGYVASFISCSRIDTKKYEVVFSTENGHFTNNGVDIGNSYALHNVFKGTSYKDAFASLQDIDKETDESSSIFGLPKISGITDTKTVIGYLNETTPITCNDIISGNVTIKANWVNGSIQLNKTELNLIPSETKQLSATVLPEGISQNVEWSTDDETVATVSDAGLVAAVGQGITNITVTSRVNPFVIATCNVIVDTQKPFETCDWSYLNEKCTALETANFSKQAITDFCSSFTLGDNPSTQQVETEHTPDSLDDFIGYEKKARVNGVDHRIRCIGYQHDVIAEGDLSGKKAALTFEFANVISDNNGHSIATLWKDTASTSGVNYNYLNSTLRYNLTHQGAGGTLNYWFQKGATTHSETYSGKSVLDMINDQSTGTPELGDALKTVTKNVATNSSGWIGDTTYEDKLFILTGHEIGSGTQDHIKESKDSVYDYYKDLSSLSQSLLRIKKQVNESEKSTASASITSSDEKSYYDIVLNLAGYNYEADETGGTFYWLSSPYTIGTVDAWRVDSTGSIFNNGVYAFASAVSPAFCI